MNERGWQETRAKGALSSTCGSLCRSRLRRPNVFLLPALAAVVAAQKVANSPSLLVHRGLIHLAWIWQLVCRALLRLDVCSLLQGVKEAGG